MGEPLVESDPEAVVVGVGIAIDLRDVGERAGGLTHAGRRNNGASGRQGGEGPNQRAADELKLIYVAGNAEMRALGTDVGDL